MYSYGQSIIILVQQYSQFSGYSQSIKVINHDLIISKTKPYLKYFFM